MPREKEKVVEVKLDNGQIVKIKVIRPTNRLNSEAQRIGATVWTQCIQDGVMTKQELQRILKEKGIWGKEQEQKEKDITSEIAELEKKLYLNKKKKLKLSEAKNFAIDMRKKRNELRDHIAQRIALEGNTAEALSDNAKFDFLVANCTFYENGNKVYNTLESYQDSADDVLAFTAAATLAEMVYALDSDFEANLPENRFLKSAGLVNEELSLVDKEGNLIDLDGRRINNLGWYQDEEGNRVDQGGNKLSEDGTYIPQVVYIDDETGEEVVIEGEEEPEEVEEKGEEKETKTTESK
tara:strand:+ start:4063 stop:4947 length:885 start_codon:yes stop_codon:yes gene_type:complete